MSRPIKEVCSECGGSNIEQQITMMVDPNDPPEQLDWNDVVFDDYYWCKDCENDCGVDEVANDVT